MEQYKIYQDESYVMYEMSPLFYTELQPYIEDMLLQIRGAYMDEQIWQRLWSEEEKLNFSSTPLFMVRAMKDEI